MDSTEIDNELIIEAGKCKPIKVVLTVNQEDSVAEPESAWGKLTDRVKAVTPEKPVFVRWNKRTGTYELVDNLFIPDGATIIGSCDPKTIILMNWAEETRATERIKALEDWLMEQDLFKSSDE